MIAIMLAALLLQAAAPPQEDEPNPFAYFAEQQAPAPAPAQPTGTTPEAADHACRGQIHRRPGETRVACIARLVETDALSVPLPVGNTPRQGNQCRRVSTQSEDGSSSSFRVICSSGDSELAEEMLDNLLLGD